MATLQIFEGQTYPPLVDCDTWEFQGGSFPGLWVRDVVGMTFRRAAGAPPCRFRSVQIRGEDPCWCRVSDGCDGTVLDGLDGVGSYHGIRLTACADCKVWRCRSDANSREGLLAGFTDRLEIGWYSAQGNGRGSASADKSHGCYVSEKSVDVWIHDIHCQGNSGSGLQLNGTPESDGVLLMARVERASLVGNGGSDTGTPNLSMISCVECTLSGVSTGGGRGGLRMFTYGGGVPCRANRFLGLRLAQEGTQFSGEFLDGTTDTTFDETCVVEGPELQADASSELPRWV